MILVLDIDGTLADTSHRDYLIEAVPYAERTQEDWDKFLDVELMVKDAPIKKAQVVIPNILYVFDKVLFLTSRPEYSREVTVDWLDRYFNMRPDTSELFMRPEDAKGTAPEVKDIIAGALAESYNDLYFIDDEVNNIEVLKNHGSVLKAPECWDMLAKQIKVTSHRIAGKIDTVSIESIAPLHEVKSTSKLDFLIDSMTQSGWEGEPLIVEPYGDGYLGWTGSHRWAAAKKAGIKRVPVVVIDYDNAASKLEELGISEEDYPYGIVGETIDDNDRLDVLKFIGDNESIEIMEKEVEGNASKWNQQFKEDVDG